MQAVMALAGRIVERHGDPYARKRAVEVLGEIGNITEEGAVRALASCLEQSNEKQALRIAAAKALAKIGKADQAVVNTLVAALEGGWGAAEALGELGDRVGKHAVAALVSGLEKPNTYLYAHSASALGQIGKSIGSKAIAVLLAKLRSREPDVRATTLEALQRPHDDGVRIVGGRPWTVGDLARWRLMGA
jgi:HEAT repeat protein